MRPTASQPVTQLDLKMVWSAVRGQKWLIAGMTLLSLLAVIAFAAIAKPQYTAVTQILIDPSDLHVVENGLTSNNQMPEVAVIQAESQVRVLTSDNVLR